MQQNTSNSAMKTGLIVGVILSVQFIMGTINNFLFSFVALFISFYIIYWLYRQAVRFRDTENNGTISYWKSFFYLFQIYIYGSIILSLTLLIYTSLINQNYLPTLLNETLKFYDNVLKEFYENMLKINVTDEMYNYFELIYKPAPFALMNIVSGAMHITFWGLILAAFVKKDKGIFE